MRAALEAARELGPRRLIAVFQPHLYSRTKALAEEFGAALAARRRDRGARGLPGPRGAGRTARAGVSGRLVAEAAAERAGGRPVWWLPDASSRPGRSEPRLGEGDLLLTIGAGDIFRLAEDLVDGAGTGRARERARRGRARLPARAADDVRVGGPADYFARPESEQAVVELLAWAEAEGLAIGVVGSGSNLLVADEGFRGLVLKLAGELTRIEREGTRVVCGGGARLPSAAAKTAGWGLAGLEFGVNIPGTVGGAVRMNANAYGGELGAGAGVGHGLHRGGQRAPDPGAARLSLPRLGHRRARGRRRGELRPGRGRCRGVKATMAEMRRKRKEAQPSGIKTFGSTFVNPDDPRAEGRSAGQLLDAAGARGPGAGRRPALAEARELRRERRRARPRPTCWR